MHGRNSGAVHLYEHMGLVVTDSAFDDWGGAAQRVLTMEIPLAASPRAVDVPGKDG